MNIKIWAGVFSILFAASSCDDFLDINDNPNSPISADVQLVLPQAITASASIANQFNSYGGHFGGFIANAGGFSGFGNLLNYNLQPTDYNNLWVNTYQDPLADLNYVISETEGIDELAFYNAAAKIMTVVNYQRLVDAFGDIPYSQSLKGEEGINAPVYDDAASIYQNLLVKLDEAMDIIDNAEFPLRLTRASDPLFGSRTATERSIGEQMLDWKRYANTLKLRILVRLGDAGGFAGLDLNFVASDNTPAGSAFLEDDAVVNPGYEKNRPNPTWATWGRTTADALANSSRVPTTFSFSFYNGTKISDSGRGETMFVNFPTTPINQLGNEVGNPTIVAGQVTWASNQAGLAGTGVLKGPGMGRPLMLLAEARFLQAEAELNGFIAGDYIETYYEGITASFAYLYEDENGGLVQAPAPLVTAYTNNNAGNRLVEIEAAADNTQRLEAIITQKYIAMNMITSDEAWNEYRRTGFPSTVAGGAPPFDIASNKSNVTSRADRLPTRILYPSSEQSFNASNYRVVDFTSERIFWDIN
ncbi:SusD/RagB family nutrient-binding outer membrane lipoprotein [Chryseotalea sanaruensis]|nr:SusD/RagB family nutrient-binding outer membrane lipoprotein [Chryseotalea sanaruensis]